MTIEQIIEEFHEAWGQDDLLRCFVLWGQLPEDVANRELTLGMSFTMHDIYNHPSVYGVT